ncbi:alpha/beta hydrolase family protein [Streptomyces sp. NPDC053750]|uniref:alpha/beta hydrolase family protein n=1 Tax=Streptomyces sp. NPDC053750 TaxID=3365714 RepID=UPI0037D25722
MRTETDIPRTRSVRDRSTRTRTGTTARVLGVLLTLLAALVPLTGATAAADDGAPLELILPEPTGPYEVGEISAHLVDAGRPDPWEPDRSRELMVSVWYPAKASDAPRAPWLSPGAASVFEQLMAIPQYLDIPVGSVDWAGAETHARVAAPVLTKGGKKWPLVLFSAAQGTTRQLNSVQVEDLASRGYVVVTIDHTYESAAVEFPGGRVVPGKALDRTPETQKISADSRVADTRFVLDRLTALSRSKATVFGGTTLPRGLGKAFSLRDVGMFGHVQGGYTTVESMYHDPRIDAGINLDGELAHGTGLGGIPYVPGEAARHGVGRPVLLMGAERADATGTLVDHNHVNGFDRSWADFWAAQTGFKRDLTLADSALDSYADFTFFLPQITAVQPLDPEIVRLFIGTVDPTASLTAQRAYIGAFFDRFLKDKDTGLLDGPSSQYPEITFVTD